MPGPEYWLRGPVEGVAPLLQPVAHALLQAGEDLTAAASPLTREQVWTKPGGAASVGFHLRHLAGSLDRLLTYARGEALTADQLAFLKSEGIAGDAADAASILAFVGQRIDAALEQVRRTPADSLLEERRVGRQALPTTVIGLLFHAAEHTTRHAGQVMTTARIVTGS